MAQDNVKLETLEIETIDFIQKMPYWLKYISVKLIEKGKLDDKDYDLAIHYLCEDIGIYKESDRPDLKIGQITEENQSYYQVAILNKLEHVGGANALKENMTIEFHPQLTVLFGENGSGKTSYTRLLKWIFFSRSKEKILPNVFADEGSPLEARVFIETEDGPVILQMPGDEEISLTDQFSVFDNKSVIEHLDVRNEFEFRPAGLVFFTKLSAAINEIEHRVSSWIDELTPENPFIDLLDGESEIKDLIKQLETGIEANKLAVYTPYSDEDEKEKERLTKQHDELLISTKQLETTIHNYKNIIADLRRNKDRIEKLNSEFSEEAVNKVYEIIKRVVGLEKSVKEEGSTSFQNELFSEVGSNEWREFLQAAHEYASLEDKDYPKDSDFCIFCHQGLSVEAAKLIRKYWSYLQSEAEDRLKSILSSLEVYQAHIIRFSFDLFPEDSRLTLWLNQYAKKYLDDLTEQLTHQSKLPDQIITRIEERSFKPFVPIQIDCSYHDILIKKLEAEIIELQKGNQQEKLDALRSKLAYLNHKKKLNQHFKKIEAFINNYNIASRLHTVRWMRIKRGITDSEKYLSTKYFSADYVRRFNEEVEMLNGHVQIEVDSRGAAGSSNRQLLIKGNNPSSILSDSEQKVAAISDFIVEMELSEINKGLIFDDPSTSLDDFRKSELGKRLVKVASCKQVIIFTHDLSFLSTIIETSKEIGIELRCHWIESIDGQPGLVYLDNTPSFEKVFKRTGKAQEWCNKAKSQGPEERENSLRSGFAALRTSYEAFVVFEVFAGVVQRFAERVSIDSLSGVRFNDTIRDLVLDGFYKCCRYMEGHSHSDKYASKKPTIEALQAEIDRFNDVRKKIKEIDKDD